MTDDPLETSMDRLQGEIADLRRSRRRLVAAADADRRAIERELHDGVQQQLVALAVDLRRLAGLIDDDPMAAKALVDELTANVRAAMTETTELAERIYPPLLAARGLASALRSAAERAWGHDPGRRSGVPTIRQRSRPPSTGRASRRCHSRHAGPQATVNVHRVRWRAELRHRDRRPTPGRSARPPARSRRGARWWHRPSTIATGGGSRVHGWAAWSR